MPADDVPAHDDQDDLPGPTEPTLLLHAPPASTPDVPDLVPVLVRLGADPDAAASVQGDLLSRWSEPHRSYHDTRHLAEVLHRVDLLAGHAEHPDLVRLAAWWHDAVHEGRAGTDEQASAALARQQLDGLGLSAHDVSCVVGLVLVTVRHDPGEPPDADAAVLCDADLGVLAAPPHRYAGYAADVRREYADVPQEQFTLGRAAVLRRLTAAGRLFRTPTGAGWEAAARANVRLELAALSVPPP